MTGYFTEHQEGTEGLGTAGKDTEIVGGRYPCVRKNLLETGTSGSIVRIGIMGCVRGDVKDGGENPYNFTKIYHGEEIVEKYRRDVGDNRVQRSF